MSSNTRSDDFKKSTDFGESFVDPETFKLYKEAALPANKMYIDSFLERAAQVKDQNTQDKYWADVQTGRAAGDTPMWSNMYYNNAYNMSNTAPGGALTPVVTVPRNTPVFDPSKVIVPNLPVVQRSSGYSVAIGESRGSSGPDAPQVGPGFFGGGINDTGALQYGPGHKSADLSHYLAQKQTGIISEGYKKEAVEAGYYSPELANAKIEGLPVHDFVAQKAHDYYANMIAQTAKSPKRIGLVNVRYSRRGDGIYLDVSNGISRPESILLGKEVKDPRTGRATFTPTSMGSFNDNYNQLQKVAELAGAGTGPQQNSTVNTIISEIKNGIADGWSWVLKYDKNIYKKAIPSGKNALGQPLVGYNEADPTFLESWRDKMVNGTFNTAWGQRK